MTNPDELKIDLESAFGGGVCSKHGEAPSRELDCWAGNEWVHYSLGCALCYGEMTAAAVRKWREENGLTWTAVDEEDGAPS